MTTLTPRQQETYDKVNAYRAEHGVGIQAACKALGLNSATYGNAQRSLRFGPTAYWRKNWRGKGGCVTGSGVASDREAFEFDEEELPF